MVAFDTVYIVCGQCQLQLHVLSIAKALSTLAASFPDNWNGHSKQAGKLAVIAVGTNCIAIAEAALCTDALNICCLRPD